MQNNLIKLRKEKGLSQEELADKLSVSRQAISKWERGESLPDTDNLIRLAKLYGVSIDEIVGINQEKTETETATAAYASDGEKEQTQESVSEKEQPKTEESDKKEYTKRNIVMDSICVGRFL